MITDEEFKRISVFMKQKYGIDLSQKKTIVNGRLENYIKKQGYTNFNAFMDLVEQDKTVIRKNARQFPNDESYIFYAGI